MYNLLLVEDDESMAHTINHYICENSNIEITITYARNREEFAEKFNSTFDIIVADYNFNDETFNGSTIIKEAIKLNIPVIVLSGYLDEDYASTIMKYGAADLITKKNLNRLIPAIEREIFEYYHRKEQLKKYKISFSLLSCVARSVNWILKHDISEVSLSRILNDYISIVDADRIYIFERLFDDNGYYYSKLESECRRLPSIESIVLYNKIYEKDAPNFFHKLMDGSNGVSFISSNLGDIEKSFFMAQGIKSIAAIPIFTPQNEIWGFFGFDDCVNERIWSDLELKALESVSAIVGTILYKMKMEENIQEQADCLIKEFDTLNNRIQRMQARYQ